MTQEQAARLGKVWEKNGMKRMYINGDTINAAIGLEIDCYKTGNVSHATLKGEAISHAEAGRIIAVTGNYKYWFDFSDGSFNRKFVGQFGIKEAEITLHDIHIALNAYADTLVIA